MWVPEKALLHLNGGLVGNSMKEGVKIWPLHIGCFKGEDHGWSAGEQGLREMFRGETWKSALKFPLSRLRGGVVSGISARG